MVKANAPEVFRPIDLEHFEQILLDRRKSLLGDAQALERGEAESAGNHSKLSSHFAELGTDFSSYDVSLACRESVTGEIQEIDDALDLVREGSFGICDMCGQHISSERLEAIPYARLCLPCKKDEEAL